VPLSALLLALKLNQVGMFLWLYSPRFQSCFPFQDDEDVDLDEVECIVANLIFQKFMKGYISHEKATLVLSVKDAFPPAQRS
jgi:hypothetical protein